MRSNNILLGINETQFNPNSHLSQAMFVTALNRVGNQQAASVAAFTDVPSGAYYTNAVSWAFENKITSGYGNKQFKPHQSITREQLAVMAYNYAKYAKLPLSDSNSISAFADQKVIASWATEAIGQLNEAGIMRGKANGQFDPKATVTRAEAAVVLHRLLELR